MEGKGDKQEKDLVLCITLESPNFYSVSTFGRSGKTVGLDDKTILPLRTDPCGGPTPRLPWQPGSHFCCHLGTISDRCTEHHSA